MPRVRLMVPTVHQQAGMCGHSAVESHDVGKSEQHHKGKSACGLLLVISPSTMEEERAQLCAPSGRVARAQSITERSPTRPRGFGCVEIPNATEAQAAMAGLHGTPVAGRPLTVHEAHRREGEQRLPRRDHP